MARYSERIWACRIRAANQASRLARLVIVDGEQPTYSAASRCDTPTDISVQSVLCLASVKISGRPMCAMTFLLSRRVHEMHRL
jgi:hypothetical protein